MLERERCEVESAADVRGRGHVAERDVRTEGEVMCGFRVI
jgi:hypothetical protein